MSHHAKDAESIFLAALQRDTSEARAAYLDQTCGTDTDLRQEVDALLAAHDSAGSFLARPPAALCPTDGVLPWSDMTAHHEDAADITLDFLEPCGNPERLGKLGPYEIVDVVGRGGMGIVLKGYDPKLSRVVAIKVLMPELAANAMAKRRFLREAQSAAAISHDHVVTIHAVHDDGQLPFIVMEYISGQSLQQRVDRSGPLEVKEILRIGKQIATGLAAAHAEGLTHRDVKPANILLENGIEKVKVTDFGLARATDDVQITRTGVVAGTPQYMSPEQARGEKVDCRADLFSLGCVIYAMCTGRSPFRAETIAATIRRVCDDTPRPLTEINADLPEFLAVVVARLLEKDPSDRFQSAAEVCELLERYLAHLQQPSAIPMPSLPHGTVTPPKTTRTRRRRLLRLTQTAAAVFLTALLAVGVSDATGITNVGEYVMTVLIRNADYGTLAVKIMDPNVGVTIEGDGNEITLTGIGTHEIRLRPGKHVYQAVKDGKLVEKAWVTVMRGEKRVVEVRPAEGATATGEFASVQLNLQALERNIETLLTLEGKEKTIVRASPCQEELQLPPGSYHIRCQAVEMSSTLRTGTIQLMAGTTRGVTRGIFEYSAPPAPAERDYTAEILTADGAAVRQIAFFHKHKILAAAYEDGVRLCQPAGQDWQVVHFLEGHEGPVTCLTVSNSDRILASGGRDGRIVLWETENNERLATLFLRQSEILSVAISPDEDRVASLDASGKLVLWNLEDGTVIRQISAHEHTPWRRYEKWLRVLFLPCGESLVTGGWGKTVKIWKADTLALQRELSGVSRFATDLALSRDGGTLAAADPAGTKLWNTSTGDLLGTLPTRCGYSHSVAISANRKWIVCGRYDGVRLYDMESRKLVAEFPTHWDLSDSMAFCPSDPSLLATAGRDGVIRFWDVSSFPESESAGARPGPQPVNAFLTFCGPIKVDGDRMAAIDCSHHGYLKMWDLKDLRVLAEETIKNKRGFYDGHCGLAVVGTDIVSADQGKLWHCTFDEVDGRLRVANTRTIDCENPRIAASRDGRWLAASEKDAVCLLDSTSLEVLHRFAVPNKTTCSLVFSPRRPLLAIGTNKGEIVLWDVDARKRLVDLRHGESRVLGLAFSPSGEQLASTSQGGTVKLWNVQNPESPVKTTTLKGHNGVVFSADFSSDGKWLATAGGFIDFSNPLRAYLSAEPGEIRIWNVSREELGAKITTDKCALDAQFACEGKWLIVNADAKHTFWDVSDVLSPASVGD